MPGMPTPFGNEDGLRNCGQRRSVVAEGPFIATEAIYQMLLISPMLIDLKRFGLALQD